MATVRVPVIVVVAFCSLLIGVLISGGPRAISEEKPAPKPCDVAVLDVTRVFEKYEGFQGQMGSLKTEVDSFELVIKQAQKELQDMKQQLEGAETGSDLARRLETEMATKAANLNVEVSQTRKRFLEKEAGVYFQRYSQIQKVVEDIARRKQIRVVLRYTSAKIDGGKRESVLEGVNRAVVFQDQLDISDEVIKAVNAT